MKLTGPTSRRIYSRDVARLTGFSVRIVQMMAIKGELPHTLQRKPGGRWTFDEAAVRKWIKEWEAPWPATGGPAQTAHRWRPDMAGKEVNEALERALWPNGRKNDRGARRG